MLTTISEIGFMLFRKLYCTQLLSRARFSNVLPQGGLHLPIVITVITIRVRRNTLYEVEHIIWVIFRFNFPEPGKIIAIWVGGVFMLIKKYVK